MIHLDADLAQRLESVLHALENRIRDDLAPEFASARMDPESGAVVVHGWEGDPLCLEYQASVVRAGAALEQHGLHEDDARRLATRAMDFMLRHLWDPDHAGWVEHSGAMDGEKRTWTQGCALAALAEFLMVSGDFEVAERVVETFKTIQVFCADNCRGGYAARFTRDWSVVDAQCRAGDMTVLCEAFGVAYQAIGADIYRRRAVEALRTLLESPEKTIQPETMRTAALLDAPELAAAVAAQASTDTAARAELDQAVFGLEAWRLTGDPDWLRRSLDAPACDATSRRLPDALRKESLLLKALYGPKA